MSNRSSAWGSVPLRSIVAVDGLFCDGDWVESKDQDPQGSIRLLQLADIGDGRFLDKSSRFINEAKFAELRCTELVAGDVLVARMPDPLGRACLMPELPQRCITVVDVAAIRPGRDSADARWLMHTINAPQFRQAMALQSSGTTRKRISRGNLGDLSIPLPPLQEQQRIAGSLDTVLARVDACRDHLARVASLLKRFRQSALSAATSGHLSSGLQGACKWPRMRAADVCAKVQSGGTPKAGFTELSGVPFLKVYNIVDQMIDFNYRPQFVSQSVHEGELGKSQAIPGDVVMNIVGPPLGKVAILPHSSSEWNINQAITLFRPSARITSGWLYVLLCEGEAVRQVLGRTKGSVGQVNISLSQCRDFEFPVPSIEEQAEIVRRVQTLFAFADRLEARLTAARSAVDRLTPALLAKAFRGELVPQDPADEPASELLRRLAEDRSPPSSKPRKRQAA